MQFKKIIAIAVLYAMPDFIKRMIYIGALFKKLVDANDPHAVATSIEEINSALQLTKHHPSSVEVGYFFSNIIFPNVNCVNDIDSILDMNHLKNELPQWQRWGNSEQMHSHILQLKSVLAAH